MYRLTLLSFRRKATFTFLQRKFLFFYIKNVGINILQIKLSNITYSIIYYAFTEKFELVQILGFYQTDECDFLVTKMNQLLMWDVCKSMQNNIENYKNMHFL